jgi:hypothetical protein
MLKIDNINGAKSHYDFGFIAIKAPLTFDELYSFGNSVELPL